MTDTKTILVVDDDADSRNYLSALLEPSGYRVFHSSDGEIALSTTLRERPDLVICDVLMPKVDGFEYLRRVRETPLTKGTRVIFFTAQYLETNARELALGNGVSNVLYKPCEPAVLLQAVEECLSGEPPATTVADDFHYRETHLRLLCDKLAYTESTRKAIAQRLAAVLELNLELASQRDSGQLLNLVCEGARELLNGDHALLAASESSEGQFSHIARSNLAQELEPVETWNTLLHKVWVERQSRRLENESLTTHDIGLPEDFPPFGSMLAAPLLSLTRSYGWLCVTRAPGARNFDHADELLLKILGAQTGRVFENSTLYNKVFLHSRRLEQEMAVNRRSRNHLQAEFAVASILATTRSLDEVAADLLKTVGEHLDLAGTALYTGDNGGFRLVELWAEQRDAENPLREALSGRIFDASDNPLVRVAASRTPLWSKDVSSDTRFDLESPKVLEALSSAPIGATNFLPLNVRGKSVGVLTAVTHEQAAPGPALMDVLITISNQVGQFMDSCRHLEQIERLNRQYAMLSGINAATVRVKNVEQLFRAACDIAIYKGGHLIASFAEFDPEGHLLSPLIASCADGVQLDTNAWAETLAHPDQLPATRFVIQSGDILLSNNIREDDRAFAELPLTQTAIRLGCRSAATLPISHAKDSHWLLALYSAEVDAFSDAEKLLMAEMASTLAFAIQHLENEKLLAQRALVEPLTGLMSRAALKYRLEEMSTVSGGATTPFALLLFDVNEFHQFNDNLGHTKGDELLLKLARGLETKAWDCAHIACLGGDHFGLIFENVTHQAQVDDLVQRILKMAHSTFEIGGLPVNVEVTIGAALFPQHGSQAEVLWQRADIALREARRRHLPYLCYSRRVDQTDATRVSLLGGLREAIRNNELVLHYQPKLDLRNSRISGVEGLVRWQKPGQGLIFPDQFLPGAERTELIHELTAWVLEEGTRQAVTWAKGGMELEFSLNLSVRNLQNPNLTSEIMGIVEHSGLPLRNLMLEITESAVMNDPVKAQRTLQTLNDAGIQLALDDFGIGYSSLAYLQTLPLHRLKIDKVFTFDIASIRTQGIISGTIDLAHRLGLSVTAEGVENDEALSILNSFGCDAAQGYNIARPISAEDFPRWLAQYELPAFLLQAPTPPTA